MTRVLYGNFLLHVFYRIFLYERLEMTLIKTTTTTTTTTTTITTTTTTTTTTATTMSKHVPFVYDHKYSGPLFTKQ